MKDFPLRSPGEKVGGIVYFGRMLDKIRLHAKGELPNESIGNLGKGFDRFCVGLLRIEYDDLVARVTRGGTDEEILASCFETGRRPTEDDVHIWNGFMRKCGWKDKLSEMLTRRKEEAGVTARAEIETMFQFIDADEGRL